MHCVYGHVYVVHLVLHLAHTYVLYLVGGGILGSCDFSHVITAEGNRAKSFHLCACTCLLVHHSCIHMPTCYIHIVHRFVTSFVQLAKRLLGSSLWYLPFDPVLCVAVKLSFPPLILAFNDNINIKT